MKIAILKCTFLIILSGCSTQTALRKTTEVKYDEISQAIGYLVNYQTESKIDLSYGTSSPLEEVITTYHTNIAQLPKKEQAKFFFLVDTNINVHGGEDLPTFYNLIYLCCEKEYITLLKQNLNNPYFKPNMINIRLKSIESRETQIKLEAQMKEKSFNQHLQELKLEYGFE